VISQRKLFQGQGAPLILNEKFGGLRYDLFWEPLIAVKPKKTINIHELNMPQLEEYSKSACPQVRGSGGPGTRPVRDRRNPSRNLGKE
jgi:hypothetical protein